jgi:hypothetical protein
LSDEPVVRAAELDGEHYGAVLTAAYTHYYGVHHAYLVGFGDLPGDQHVFHAMSADGLLWNLDREDPFASLGLDLSPPGPIPGTVLPDGGGGWLMYLWGVPSPLVEGALIYRATSDSIGGPWVADPDPVLELGASGAWDDRALDFPAVVGTDDGFVMAYSAVGYGRPGSTAIGWATSSDGIAWERATPDTPLMESGVCGADTSQYVAAPRLVSTDDGYLMLFDSARREFAATSPDGVTWSCLSEVPLLAAEDVPESAGIHTIAATDVDARVSVLVESLTNRDGLIGSDVWLGEVEGL